MKLTDKQSLSKTVHHAAQFLFDGGTYTTAERARLANWILAHQNRHRGFVFYPTDQDLKAGITLFSGEKPKAKFLAYNALELETLRLLALIQPKSPPVRRILREADQRLSALCFANGCTQGECAHASIAVLRYWLASDLRGSSPKFSYAINTLKQHRSGDGKWLKFPFFFTLLWLTELPGYIARDELAYVAGLCQKLLATQRLARGQNDRIRKKILQRVLARTA